MKSKAKRLDELKDKMQEAAQIGDPEVAHDIAGDLLCEVVSVLAGKAEHEVVADILAAYSKVGKFYA